MLLHVSRILRTENIFFEDRIIILLKNLSIDFASPVSHRDEDSLSLS